MRRNLIVLAALLCGLLAPTAAAEASTGQSTMFEAPNELLSDDPQQRAQTFDELEAFGVKWIRVIVYWRDVAPQPESAQVPDFDETDPSQYPGFGRYDRIIREADARGINVMVTVSGPVPRCATRLKRDQVTDPSPTRFARFFEAIAKRYAEDVRYWAVWNEPNHPDFLQPQYGGQGSKREALSPDIYRRLFQAAQDGLKAAGQEDDRLIFGELAPRGTGSVVAPLQFFRESLCLTENWNKRSYCEQIDAHAVGIHPHTTRSGPYFEPPQRDDVTIGVLGRLNSAMAKAAREDALPYGTDIWITEFGIQSKPDDLYGVSETTQAEYRAISERISYRNDRVRMFSQYLMRDDRPTGEDEYGGFESGLRTWQGDEKRAYDGFRLPMVAYRSGDDRTYLWGLVRPVDAKTKVSIDYRRKGSGAWRYLKRDTTNSSGYWSTRTSYRSDRRYRVRWTDASGTEHTGPLTRVNRRPD